ncbi:MAG: carbohydrate ABC transporter permease [Lachnospiraceae bacterium]|nr:carbohydrate ABC transporter permease [Lachnospiraceae bacterium]
MKKSLGNRIFDICNYIFLAIIGFVMLYPFYYCIILAFNEGVDTQSGGIWFWPREFTLANFEQIFNNATIVRAIAISVARTFAGVILAVLVTSMFAFSVSRKDLKFKRFYIVFGAITMYFSGGMIPTFLLINKLGLYNNFLVYILPSMFSMSNAIMMIAFFKGLPEELLESVRMDGGSDLTIFFRIVLPVSKPILATIALFVGVGQWNSWLDTVIYTDGKSLPTLTSTLQQMMNQISYFENLTKETLQSGQMLSEQVLRMQTVTSQSFMMAMVVVTSLPIMMSYPFLQKYLIKGVMVGSLKG